MSLERVTLPNALVRAIARRADVHQSLLNPHPESAGLAEQGLAEWIRSLPAEDTYALVDGSAGKPVRWFPGEGWVGRE